MVGDGGVVVVVTVVVVVVEKSNFAVVGEIVVVADVRAI